MALSAFSKHCVITGIFLLGLSLVSIAWEMKGLKYGTGYRTHNDYLSDPYVVLAVYGVVAISSILMIFGVVKRFVLPIVPFLLCALTALGFGVYRTVLRAYWFGDEFPEFELLWVTLAVGATGIIFVIINPFVAVIREVLQEHTVKR